MVSATSAGKLRQIFGAAVVGLVVALAGSGSASATESDLRAGLAHLRAGAQGQAEQDLTKYRNGEPDSDIRQSIDRVLPLLKRPLPEDVREFIAGALEDKVRMKADPRSRRARPSYASRMFPVFP
jgi:hypothetical protein